MDPSSLWTLVTIIISLQTYTQGLPEKRLHHHMTKREIEYYFGVNDHAAVPEYDVTHPYETNEDGDFVSYPRLQSRRRRSSENPNSFYKLNAFGSNLHLKLTRNDNLMAPNLRVKRQNDDGTVTSHPSPENTFYLGRVASDPHSTVAVSSHGGLTGLVKTSQDTLFVQPLPAHLAQHVTTEKDTTPHLVYRRSVQENGALYETKEENDQSKRSVDIEDTGNVMDSSNQVSPKYLEAALVAPRSLEEKYKEGNELSVTGGVSEFLMLVANMVAGMFQDHSIGDRKITYVVTAIYIVNITEIGFSKGDGSMKKLKAMLRWAAARNKSLPEHFDVFSYVSNQIPSGGLAPINTMCKITAGNVNKDVGLQTSLVVAHEIGHCFSVGHDSGECAKHSDIMSARLPGGKYATKWSNCSRKTIQQFLANKDRSRCLDDSPWYGRPTLLPIFRDKLPGVLVDGDKQCEMQYGTSFRRFNQQNCGELQCINSQGTMLSRKTVVVDGTRCGPHNWCISGVCQNSGTGPDEFDGGWTSWSAFSNCSHPCGVGTKHRQRTCTNPRPHNGKKCSGDDVEYETCNRQPCQSGEESPPSTKIQCSKKRKNSVAIFKKVSPCGLWCKVGNKLYFHGRVEDGTRCKTDTINHGYCINGGCVPAGCDHVLRSGKKLDRCGSCDGNGTECYVVHGTYMNTSSLKDLANAVLIVKLPNATIEANFAMKAFSRNYIGVQDEFGNYSVKGPSIGRQFETAAGAQVYYERKRPAGDKLLIIGKTTAPLRVVFISIAGAGNNPGVEYQYTSFYGQGGGVAAPVFQWVIGNWSVCSKTCAIGKKTRDVHCILSEDNSSASDSACPTPVPAKVEQCNIQPCIASWSITYWTACSKTCGKGKQEREIKCLHQVNESNYEPTDSCLPEDKPTVDTTRVCNKYPCPAEWSATSWSNCSTKCARGTKYRDVTCTRIDEEGASTVLVEEFCRYKVKYENESSCNDNEPCGARNTTCPGNHDCSNGGLCESDPSGYKCNCSLGYDGLECEIILNPCDKHPCFNGGTCSPGPVSDHYTHTCTCPQYFTGRNCEVKIKACDVMPCENGGVCTDNGDPVKYTCTCNGGFMGARCQVAELFKIGCYDENTDIPVLHPKRKREINMANTNAVVLTCAELAQEKEFKYFLVGENGKCLSDADADKMYFRKGKAADSQCKRGIGKAGTYFVYAFARPTTCPANNDCSNGGVCKPDPSGYKCDCSLGYDGLGCEIILNPCDKHPCFNGGTCSPGPVSDHYNHTCTCSQYFIGRNCEVKIKACDVMPCENGGVCIDNDDPVDYTCTCSGGFMGARCQVAELFAMGCFEENIEIPGRELLAKRKREIDMANTNAVVLICAELAQKKGFKYFLVGENGKCLSGPNVDETYFRKGVAADSRCNEGVGTAGTYFVYTFG